MSKHPISDLSQYTSTSLVEIVTNTIRKNIYNGTYAPGEKLIVRELSEQLGVSHTPIKDALNRLVSEGYVEAPPRKSMYVKPFSIMDLMETLYVRAMCELSVVKIGTKGALIKQGGEVVHVGIMAAAKRVDTTGAGDFYAAGFMAGLCQGLNLRQCGTIGAITAGKVIEVVGTTFGEEAWEEIFRLVEKVKHDKYLF